MAIGGAVQAVATTLAVLRADTSQYREEMRRVTGAEKEAVKAQLAAAESRNKSLQAWAEGLTKVNVVLATVTKAVQFGAEAVKVYDERTRLAAASSHYNLEKLRQASRGLRSDTDLMRLAAAAQNTTFKLTQHELEMATKAMLAFERQGHSTAEVQKAVGEAITKGTIEPLKNFGVNIEAAKGKTGQFNQMLDVLKAKAAEVGDGQLTQAEKFRQAGTEYSNAMDSVKESIGRLVVSLAPLVKLAADIVDKAAWAIKNLPGMGGGSGGNTRDIAKRAYGYINYAANLNRDQVIALGEKLKKEYPAFAGRIQAEVDERLAQLDKRVSDYAGRKAQEAIDIVLRGLAQRDAIAAATPETKKKAGKVNKVDGKIYWEVEGRTRVYEGGGGSFGGGSTSMGADLADAPGVMGSWEDERRKLFEMADPVTQAKQTVFESVFGPLTEFKGYLVGLQLMAEALNVFTGALQSSFDAWVSGSQSAWEATKSFFKNAIGGIASMLMATAIQEGVEAIKSLAAPIPDFKGAAAHGAAAAKAAAGAIAVGVLARQFGGSGASVGAGAGPAPNVIGPAGGRGGNQGSNTTIIIGDSMADDSPRWRQKRVNDMLRRARRGSTEDGSVQYR